MRIFPVLRRPPSLPLAEQAGASTPDSRESTEAERADKALFRRPGADIPQPRARSLKGLPLELAQYFCAMAAAHHLSSDRCLRAAADVLSRRIGRRQAAEREHELREYRVRRARRYEQRG